MKRIVLLCAVLAAALATAASAGSNVNGLYVTKLSGLKPAALNAEWIVSIAQSRAYAIARNGTTVVGGKLKVSGSKLTFTDVLGPLKCPAAQAVGVYGYRLSGKTMKFTRYSDKCAARALVLTTKSFTKTK